MPSRRIHGAPTDTKVGPPVVTRLANAVPEGDHATNYAAYLDGLVISVSDGGTKQAGAAGDISTLTKAQALAYTEMERLMSSARRSAGLAFPGQDALLHAEFKVGIHEPQDLANELERASIIQASSVKCAAQLVKHVWIVQDAKDLNDAIKLLGGKDENQEASKDHKRGVTAARPTSSTPPSSPPKTPPASPTPAPRSAPSKASKKPAPASSLTNSPRAAAAPTSRLLP